MRIIIICLHLFIGVSAQKHDFVWTLGTGNTFVDSIHGGTDLDFKYSPVQVRYINRETKFYYTNSSMSDIDGNLLYYTNGCSVINKNQETLINGTGINSGNLYDEWCLTEGYYVLLQSVISLPFNNNKSKFGLFHLSGLKISNSSNIRRIPCYYSEIDMSNENGRGELIRKNVPIITDTLSDFIKAVKHSDGKSWWIIGAGRTNNIYYRIKFNDGKIEGPYLQTVDDTCKNPNGTGQAVFSPDGRIYAHFDPWTGLIIYDFDRETGLLSKREKIDFWDNPNLDFYRGGLSFSPNGKLLYLSTTKYMYQFDLEQTPIKDTRMFLDSIDGFSSPFVITFLYHELAPDGKIYISSGNSVNYWGVINNPDERGPSCNFKQHSFKLATLNFWCLPNFPNYRLGPSLASKDNSKYRYKLSPNPIKQHFSFDQLDKNGVLKIFDQNGHLVHFQKLSPYYNIIYVNHLVPGIYFTSLEVESKLYWEKFIKQ